MASQCAEVNEVFTLPIDIIRSTPFGMDIGSSMAKLVYRDKKDRAHNSDPKQTMGKLRMTVLSPKDVKQENLIKFVEENCDLDLGGEKQSTVTVTGVQSGSMEEAFTKKFGIKFKYYQEMQAFRSAIVLLSKSGLRHEEIFLPLPEDGVKAGNDLATIYTGMANWSKEVGLPCKPAPEQGMLPCIVAMLGSGTCFLEIYEDGGMELADGSFKGGRTFLGLSSLLTGENDFEKLLEMSNRGDRHKVDMSLSDFRPPSHDDNPYDRKDETDVSIHIMGKASTKAKEDVKHEDVMDSLFSMWAVDIAQLCHLVAISRNIPRVYFVGSFVCNEKVRRYMTREFKVRNGVFSHGREEVKFEFFRHGGHIGALGALIQNSESQKDASDK